MSRGLLPESHLGDLRARWWACRAAFSPAGLTRGRLPVGLQLVGRRYDDLGLLDVAALMEPLFPPEEPPCGLGDLSLL